ncbi:MAG TPA: precorrin-6y C5,15-methyltransferase (decarboxylating) subunit CbiE [Bauldia sp.]|nr:precorrin-6y C5,15-methyltransferase (decarboxylating) subunit CbiE [Bauldia sp.]
MSAPDPIDTDNAAPHRWLAIVGIGEDGIDGLTPAARRLVESAEIVFGGKRHLALAAPLVRGAVRSWPSPFDGAVDEVLAHRGRAVCVLATGDPFHYGVGPLLAKAVPLREIVALPAPSAFSLAAARLGWPLADTVLLSLHGRAPDLIRPHLHPGTQILALTSDGEAPAAVARLLADAGFGPSRIVVMEALGGARERVRTTSAARFDLSGIDALNTIAIEVAAGPAARIIPLVPGLPDALFEHDGQITKREIRAITLSSLAPRRGELLWDVGAGAGSVAIEWMLAGRSLRAVAVESEPARAARIARNAAALGTPGLSVVEGRAPSALAGLDPPDAVVLGCGAGEPAIVDAAIAALRAGGRLVVNAVTLESEAALFARQAELGGELIRIALARAEPLGGQTGWRPAMPITQWVWVKP